MIAGQNITHNPEYIQRRFWTKVAVAQDITQCWPWLRGRWKTGYGQFSYKLKPFLAHRLAYCFFYDVQLDEIAELEIMHECDNPPCCNPFHLEPGTHAQNQDQIGLRRAPKCQTISPEHVRYIRQQVQWRRYTSIAKELHIDRTSVSLIARRKIRRHVLD